MNLQRIIIIGLLLTCLSFGSSKKVFAQAMAQPAPTAPITTDSRIKTLVYNANEVFQLKFHYGYQSYIEFSSDEEIEMISIGESFAWRLTPAGRRLFVRPLEIGAHTNMTIITNKRTYQFDIGSAQYDGRADEQLVYVVRFYYPEFGIPLPIPPQLSRPNAAPMPNSMARPTRPQDTRMTVKNPLGSHSVDKFLGKGILNTDRSSRKNLNFRYSIAGNSNIISPTKVYDDGRETFFQFRNDNETVPTISTVDIYGNEQPIGYVIRENFIVLETTSPQFTLRLANELLCIFNEKIVSAPPTARADFYQKSPPY
ncbi:MAG: type IV secretion system protein VirB9 [Lentimonas sp.]|jgi:type IV secretion system protein VirB9